MIEFVLGLGFGHERNLVPRTSIYHQHKIEIQAYFPTLMIVALLKGAYLHVDSRGLCFAMYIFLMNGLRVKRVEIL
jgi:hypothetical protein